MWFLFLDLFGIIWTLGQGQLQGLETQLGNRASGEMLGEMLGGGFEARTTWMESSQLSVKFRGERADSAGSPHRMTDLRRAMIMRSPDDSGPLFLSYAGEKMPDGYIKTEELLSRRSPSSPLIALR